MLLLLRIYFCLICSTNILVGHQVHLSRLPSQAALSSGGVVVISLYVLPVVCRSGSLLGFRPIRATVSRKCQIISPLTSCHLISKVWAARANTSSVNTELRPGSSQFRPTCHLMDLTPGVVAQGVWRTLNFGFFASFLRDSTKLP